MTAFTFKVEPVGKPRMTQRDKWLVRAPVAKYRSFCDALRADVALHKLEFSMLAPLELLFVLPMPRSWSARKRASKNGGPCRSRPDIDNLIKGVLDALFEEDCGVWKVTAEKQWGVEGFVFVRQSS